MKQKGVNRHNAKVLQVFLEIHPQKGTITIEQPCFQNPAAQPSLSIDPKPLYFYN